MRKLLSSYNEYPDIAKEFTGLKHFVITRVHYKQEDNDITLFRRAQYSHQWAF